MSLARCCYVNTNASSTFIHSINVSICKNSTFLNVDDQCKLGYAGVLCASCAENYVVQKGECIHCQGGADLQAALIATGMIGIPVCIFVSIWLLCSKAESAADKADKNVGKAEEGSGAMGQIKILMSYVQILSTMPGVYSGIPWPDAFLQLTVPLNVINLNIFSFFDRPDSCSLSLDFLEQFACHMTLPGILGLALVVGYLVATGFGKKDAESKRHRWAQTMKIFIVGTLLMYPGLATRIFTVFRCKAIDGVEGEWLEADFAVLCWEGTHKTYLTVAIVFLILFILGVPFVVFVVLFTHRKSLWDANHKEHKDTLYELGGLYDQYEPQYWWFELVIILHKMFMTGAMCVIGSGTPLQPLVAW